MDYKKAGVDIDAGNDFVRRIRPLVRSTFRPEVLTDIGGFGGLFRFDPKRYKDPILVSGTDGVGTKLRIASLMGRHDTVGIDLVAMCVNDVAVCGAEPLFFLDYLAVGKLEIATLKEIVAGMSEACIEVGCSLLGGETAEMPGVYPPEKFDVAGFTVGVVEREEIIDGKKIIPGDCVIGVASSGFHSNGFSLIRKILEEHEFNLDMPCSETGLTVLETLLLPTKLYTPLILSLKKKVGLKGIAHITGGGLLENPQRVLPAGCQIQLDEGSWPIPKIMLAFKEKGALSDDEFLRVFNCGIGLVLIVAAKEKEPTLKAISLLGEKAWTIGTVN